MYEEMKTQDGRTHEAKFEHEEEEGRTNKTRKEESWGNMYNLYNLYVNDLVL